MNSSFSRTMKRIAVITSVLTLLLTAIYLVSPKEWLLSFVISAGTTAYHFLMRLAVGYTLPKLTNYDFNYRHLWFQPRKWESAFYRKLHVKKWKNRLPTYAPNQFSLTELPLHRVIQNMCGAELVHETIMVLSFLPLLTAPYFGAFAVFLITSIFAALFDSIFVIAQRFNRPRLVRIYEKQEAHAHE